MLPVEGCCESGSGTAVSRICELRWNGAGSQASSLLIQTIPFPRSLIGEEKQHLVLHNGSAEREAELVLVQHRWRLIVALEKVVVGVEGRVSKVLPHVAMILVGSRLGHHIDIRARIASIRSVVLPDLNLKLLDGIGVRHRNPAADVCLSCKIVNLGSVHLKIVVVCGVSTN